MNEEEKEITAVLEQEGYTNIRYIPGRGMCGISEFMFTYGLCYGLDPFGYDGRCCLKTQDGAIGALSVWDDIGDPSGKWIKHKGGNGEYSNPLNRIA